MGKQAKSRADELVFRSGLALSRNQAQALIMAGEVLFGAPDGEWKPVAKAGHAFSEETEFKLKNAKGLDVGRGAKKLRGAFEKWSFLSEKAKGGLCLDVGSSTGGFTQVLLEHEAAKVVALDVGTHQLHEKLRSDNRVLSLEQTHILKVTEADWQKWGVSLPFDFAVMDVSFISVCKILSYVGPWLAPGAPWVVLVKPQFELDPTRIKKGIVRTSQDRLDALEKVRRSVEADGLLEWVEHIDSPLAGTEGNLEFLVYLKRKTGEAIEKNNDQNND